MGELKSAWDSVAAKLGLRRIGADSSSTVDVENSVSSAPSPAPRYSPGGAMDGARYQAYVDAPDPLRFVENAQKPGLVRRELVREFSNVDIPAGTVFPSGYATRQMLAAHAEDIRRLLQGGASVSRIAQQLGLQELEVVWLAVADPERPLLARRRDESTAADANEGGAADSVGPTARAWDIELSDLTPGVARIVLSYFEADGRWKDMTANGGRLKTQIPVLIRTLFGAEGVQVDEERLEAAVMHNRGLPQKESLVRQFDDGSSLADMARVAGLAELDIAWCLINSPHPRERFSPATLESLRLAAASD